jgi:hypothetical protein
MHDLLTASRAILSVTPDRWLGLAATVPPELFARRPAAGEWSALECLQHLAETEALVFPARVEALLAGRDFAAFDPDAADTAPDADESPAELARRFAELRERGLRVLAEVTVADLQRSARHAELGLVTLSELLHEWPAHDLMHTVQAERAIMQPLIRGSGPWRAYFRDHDVESPSEG